MNCVTISAGNSAGKSAGYNAGYYPGYNAGGVRDVCGNAI
jgi:hypothetical protein